MRSGGGAAGVGAVGAAGAAGAPTRTILLWCPDWPVIAAVRAQEAARAADSRTGGSPALTLDAPLVLVERGEVFACSAAARREGVRRGQRVRDAQARCPSLVVLPYEEQIDLRFFEPVLEIIEETMPGVQLVRPGMCAMRARGPARYYGSEEEAALWLLDAVDGLGIPGARVGIADGPFTAEHAARAAALKNASRIRIIPDGESAAFLAPLPVGVLGQPSLGTLLRRLGIQTLGQFAELQATDVEARFGGVGAHLHALASGLDGSHIVPRVPPEELDSIVAFEPPVDRIEQVAFGFRAAADAFIAELVRAQLVCTAIRVEIDSEGGELSERSWLHPRSFTAVDVIDRLRWQLQGSGTIDSGLSSGIIRVRVVPEAVDAIGNHEQGLWGSGHDERIHHGLSRVQSMLGHGGVLTATLGGGRTLLERQNLAAWGDRPMVQKSGQQPWPGRLPPPTPTTVFEVPMPAAVFDAAGNPVDVDARGMLSAVPARFSGDGRTVVGITAWAGPWPISVRWWDPAAASAASRFQVVDDRGGAWLLVLEDHRWWVEAQYD